MFLIKTLFQKHTLPKHYHLPYFAFSHIYLYLSTKTQSFVYMKIFKRKFAIVFTSLLIILLFPACFEIVEEVSLNNDGSGSFCFTINMSQSKLNINAMLLLDSVNGRPVPKMENMKKTVSAIKEKHSSSKILIGGAPVTHEYCEKIGADFYSPDPQGAVNYLKTLVS